MKSKPVSLADSMAARLKMIEHIDRTRADKPKNPNFMRSTEQALIARTLMEIEYETKEWEAREQR